METCIQKPYKKQLLSDLQKTKIALNDAYTNFEQALDPDLIDCRIFELNALQKRYHFLLKQAQQLHIINDSF